MEACPVSPHRWPAPCGSAAHFTCLKGLSCVSTSCRSRGGRALPSRGSWCQAWTSGLPGSARAEGKDFAPVIALSLCGVCPQCGPRVACCCLGGWGVGVGSDAQGCQWFPSFPATVRTLGSQARKASYPAYLVAGSRGSYVSVHPAQGGGQAHTCPPPHPSPHCHLLDAYCVPSPQHLL